MGDARLARRLLRRLGDLGPTTERNASGGLPWADKIGAPQALASLAADGLVTRVERGASRPCWWALTPDGVAALERLGKRAPS